VQQRPIWLCSVLLPNHQQPLEDIITQAERTQVHVVPSGFHVQTDSYLRLSLPSEASGQLEVC
jgi:hypothetical protein